jgi:hypothetical protein
VNDKLNIGFSVLYALGFLFLIVLEIIGIRNKEPGDTITENWRHIDKSLHPILQWGWRVLTIGLLGWVMLHFGGSWS